MRRPSTPRAKMFYYTDCTEAAGSDIEEMVQRSEEITRETFLRRCVVSGLEWLVVRDPCVSYYKSTYKGMPCLFIEHSRIEHIFLSAQDAASLENT